MTEQNTTFAIGIACSIIGAIFLLMPWLVGSLVAVIVGLGLLLTGASCLANWFTLRVIGAGKVSLYVAIASFVMALICLIHPLTGAGAINWVVSLSLMCMGLCLLLNVVAATMEAASPRIAKGIAGVVIMVLGFTSFTNPGIICQLTGVALLIFGLANILIGKVNYDASHGEIEEVIDVTPEDTGTGASGMNLRKRP